MHFFIFIQKLHIVILNVILKLTIYRVRVGVWVRVRVRVRVRVSVRNTSAYWKSFYEIFFS